jgi:hypothetical protein
MWWRFPIVSEMVVGDLPDLLLHDVAIPCSAHTHTSAARSVTRQHDGERHTHDCLAAEVRRREGSEG